MSDSIKKACRGVLEDAVFFLVCVLVLAFGGWALGLVSIPEEQMNILEALHFNSIYAVLLVMAADTIVRLVLIAIEGER